MEVILKLLQIKITHAYLSQLIAPLIMEINTSLFFTYPRIFSYKGRFPSVYLHFVILSEVTRMSENTPVYSNYYHYMLFVR